MSIKPWSPTQLRWLARLIYTFDPPDVTTLIPLISRFSSYPHRLTLVGLALVLLMLLGLGCNESTLIGGDILDDERTSLDTATFDITLTQAVGSPFQTYSGLVDRANLATTQVGWIEDPLFGKSMAAFSMQVLPPSNTRLNQDVDYQVDSVTLVLYLDSFSNYGPVEEVRINIDRLATVLDGKRDYNADFIPVLGDRVLSDYVIRPSYVLDSNGVDIRPRIEIPLDRSVGEEVLALDSAVRVNDSAFVENFKGFHFSAATESGAYLGFSPYRLTETQGALGSSLRIVIREPGNDTSNITYALGCIPQEDFAPIIPQYAFDHTGSEAEQALAGTQEDDLFFVQGQGGLELMMDIEDLEEELENKLIVKASLTLPLPKGATLPADEWLRVLHVSMETLSGARTFVPEFNQANLYNRSPQGRIDTMGTDEELGYTFNLPVTVQNIIDGQLFNPSLILSLDPIEREDASDARTELRSVIGPRNRGQESARAVIDAKNGPIKMTVIFASE